MPDRTSPVTPPNRRKTTPDDMRSAGLLLAAMAGPTDVNLFLTVKGPSEEQHVMLTPYLAALLRELLVELALGNEVDVSAS